MGSLYRRKDSKFWWFAYYDASGKRQPVSSGTEDEVEARKLLEQVERAVAAQLRSGVADKGPLTVGRYALGIWLPERRQRGVASAPEDEDRLAHVPSWLMDMKIKDVQRVHIRDMFRKLMGGTAWKRRAQKRPVRKDKNNRDAAGEVAKKTLAPRTIRHVYGVLRVMFNDAVAEGHLSITPCTLKVRLRELPKKMDKDPTWRSKAIYTRDEVEQLISDARIPHYRRMLYGLEFLGGMRINEVTPRRWRDEDRVAEPLGRLTVATSWVPRTKSEKPGTKNGFIREVPIHPTLAKMLAEWRLSGWAEHQGRLPGPEDFIVPGPRGGILNSNSSLLRMHEDLEMLGLRKRRQHDARRTFVSLGIADGADKDILKWISHGPEGDEIMDLYTTLPWATLCDQVGKLKVQVREGKLLRMAASAGPLQLAPEPAAPHSGVKVKVATLLLRYSEPMAMTEENSGREGTRSLRTGGPETTFGAVTSTETGGLPERGVPVRPEVPGGRSNVARPPPPLTVAQAADLRAALSRAIVHSKAGSLARAAVEEALAILDGGSR